MKLLLLQVEATAKIGMKERYLSRHWPDKGEQDWMFKTKVVLDGLLSRTGVICLGTSGCHEAPKY